MFKRYSTKDFVFAALMGALMFILSFAFGSVLNIALGNPVASGFASTFIQAVVMTTAILVTRRFGIITLMWLIYGLLAIPTNMLGAMPAPFKILLGLGIGIIFDFIVWIGKYKKFSLFLGFIGMYIVLVPSTLYIYIKLGLPKADMLLKTAPYLFVIFLVESFIGIFLGLYIYNKIKNKSFVRQLST